MKVLNIVTTRGPFFANQVKILESLGVTIEVIAVPGLKPAEGGRSFWDYLNFYRSILSANREDIDLIHANYGITAPFALLQPTRPIVLSLWGSDLMGDFGFLSRRLARFFDEVVVMSPEMAKMIDQPVHVIPHAVDLATFLPMDQDSALAEIGWDPSDYNVLFPYHPSRSVKNHPLAREVVDVVNEQFDSDVILRAVSGVEHNDIPIYMNAADALLITSHHEGSPNAVKEAMACNLPVVSTNVGDVPQLLENVEPSYVASSEDELASCLSRILKRGDRSNGREHVQHLSIERMGEQYLNVYELALKSRVKD